MIRLKVLYLIEGLDCSGKKTIARKVENYYRTQGYTVRICIGPLFAPLKKLDDYLVSLTYKNPPHILLVIRKKIYLYTPLLDAILWRPKRDADIVLKASSSYRTWARAIVDMDTQMSTFFEKFHDKMVSFSGAVVLDAVFEERIKRHREMYDSGKTQKTEERRFFGKNKDLFENWNNTMTDLIHRDIPNALLIDTTQFDMEIVEQNIIEDINKLL